MTILVCIAQKHTKIALAYCEINFKNDSFHLRDIIKKTETITGIKVDGVTNYIEWVKIK